MKAIRVSRTGGSDVLEPVDVPDPAPGAGEVLVEAEAIGVNYFDLLIRTGRYRWMPGLPFILGNEMSGRVVAMGPGVTKLKTGQRVFIAGYEIGNRGGLYAQFAAVPEDAAIPLPDSIGADEATALTNYQLAHILLHHAARGVKAETVVVYGAAGGVGSALIDTATSAGIEAIGTAGSDEKCEFIRSRGASHAINYNTQNVVERVNALTLHGADIVFDHVAGKAFTEGLKMIAPLGMIVSYAVLGGAPEDDLFKAMRGNIEASPAVRCFTMHTYDHMPEPRRQAMQAAVDLLAGGVKPAIAAVFPLAEAARAHDLVESRRAIGKIVLKP
jgi:NADPH2:quinone reductase